MALLILPCAAGAQGAPDPGDRVRFMTAAGRLEGTLRSLTADSINVIGGEGSRQFSRREITGLERQVRGSGFVPALVVGSLVGGGALGLVKLAAGGCGRDSGYGDYGRDACIGPNSGSLGGALVAGLVLGGLVGGLIGGAHGAVWEPVVPSSTVVRLDLHPDRMAFVVRVGLRL